MIIGLFGWLANGFAGTAGGGPSFAPAGSRSWAQQGNKRGGRGQGRVVLPGDEETTRSSSLAAKALSGGLSAATSMDLAQENEPRAIESCDGGPEGDGDEFCFL